MSAMDIIYGHVRSHPSHDGVFYFPLDAFMELAQGVGDAKVDGRYMFKDSEVTYCLCFEKGRATRIERVGSDKDTWIKVGSPERNRAEIVVKKTDKGAFAPWKVVFTVVDHLRR